jgi:hypothetical protein
LVFQGPTLIARLIESKGGLETLGNALGLMYVKNEELVEKDNTAYLEVVHMTVAVMYNTLLLYEQVGLDWDALSFFALVGVGGLQSLISMMYAEGGDRDRFLASHDGR